MGVDDLKSVDLIKGMRHTSEPTSRPLVAGPSFPPLAGGGNAGGCIQTPGSALPMAVLKILSAAIRRQVPYRRGMERGFGW